MKSISISVTYWPFDKLSFLSIKAQERVNYPEENSVMQKKKKKSVS